MEHVWSYQNFQIQEGLKPGSTEFRYFFTISQSGRKKCHYCVWIVDDALDRFDASKDFKRIVSNNQSTWQKWVKGKIDAADFSNHALRIDRTGETEINLSEMNRHVEMKENDG